MYVSRDDDLVLNNQLLYSFPGWAMSPLPALLSCIGLRPGEQSGVFVGVLLVQLMLGQSWWWGFTCIVSNVTRRCILTPKSQILWLVQSFHPFFCNVSLALGMGRFCRVVDPSPNEYIYKANPLFIFICVYYWVSYIYNFSQVYQVYCFLLHTASSIGICIIILFSSLIP